MKQEEQQQVVVILQYNVDAANREQQYSKPAEERVARLLFQNRAPGIVSVIRDSASNIATLQELRSLADCPIQLNQFIHTIKDQTGLDIVGPFFYDKTPTSFALATFYNRALFHVLDMGLISLHDNNQAGDKICLWVLFTCVVNGKRFIVANTHFEVAPEKRKQDAIDVLFPRLRKLVDRHDGCPLIVNGDFNLFDDLDGGFQRSHIMEKYQAHDMLHPLHLEKTSTEILSGTFIGYRETDSFYKTPETMSRLDHGFLLHPYNGLQPLGHAYTVNVTNAKLLTSDLPSDHLPCVREFML